MNKVSEGKLNLMIESTDLAIAEGQFGVVLCADALAELLDRRAAEREQAAPEPDTWPLGWTFVQDGGMVRVVNGNGVAVAAHAIQQEAATEPPKPAKWERRMAKMGGSLRHNAESGEREVWWEPTHSDVMDTVDFGKTPQEAVEAAWRACKEERGER